MTHHFNPEVAVKLGVNAAIIIANLAYLQHNRQAQGGDKYYMDGCWWVHHTYQSMATVHPYFSVPQLKRIMKSLVEQGAVLKCNPDHFQRDCYWSVSPEFLHSTKSPNGEYGIVPSESTKSTVVLHDNNIEQKRGRFTPPTREELISYVDEKGYYLCDPDVFINHYSANGWKIGRGKMASWTHAAANWHHRAKKEQNGRSNGRI